jgi:steroid delta-isomerase-like uncharacterized protein
MMSSNANKDVITQFITEIWNANHLDALDVFLDPAYYDYTYEPRNREGLERALLLMQTAFRGHETLIEEIVGEGDTVAVCLTLRGTHTGPFRGLPASGKQFAIGGYRFYKVSDGKITSHRGLIDLPGLFQQIGTNN